MPCGMQVTTFGNGWDVLSEIGAAQSNSRCSTVIAVGAFRAPKTDRAIQRASFRKNARKLIVDQVLRHEPRMMVLVIDATGRTVTDGAALLAERMATETVRFAARTASYSIAALGVAVHSQQERQVISTALDRQRRHPLTFGGPAGFTAATYSLRHTLRRYGITVHQPSYVIPK